MTASGGPVGGVAAIAGGEGGGSRTLSINVRLDSLPPALVRSCTQTLTISGTVTGTAGSGTAGSGTPGSGPQASISTGQNSTGQNSTGQTATIRTPVGSVTLTLPNGVTVKPGAKVTLVLPTTGQDGGRGAPPALPPSGAQVHSSQARLLIPAGGMTASGSTAPQAVTSQPAPSGATGSSAQSALQSAVQMAGQGPEGSRAGSGGAGSGQSGASTTQVANSAAGAGAGARTAPPSGMPATPPLANPASATGVSANGASLAGPQSTGSRPVVTPTSSGSVPVSTAPAPSGGAVTVGSSARAALGPGLISMLASALSPKVSPPAAGSIPANAAPGGMADLAASLSAISPAGAQGLTAALPSPGSGLAGALAAVLGLFRSPGIRAAIGDDGMAALRRLAGRSGGDGQIDRALDSARPRLSSGPPGPAATGQSGGAERAGGEWRHWTLPIAAGTDLSAINLYWRRESDGGDGNDVQNDAPTDRFVVDLTLSAFGATRVDSRINRARRRLAIVLATEAALAPLSKLDLNRLVAKIAEGYGLTGRLTVKRTPQSGSGSPIG